MNSVRTLGLIVKPRQISAIDRRLLTKISLKFILYYTECYIVIFKKKQMEINCEKSYTTIYCYHYKPNSNSVHAHGTH